MADPTVILDDEGEVIRMTNEEGDSKISQVMEAWDLKGNLEEDSSSDFECISNQNKPLIPEEIPRKEFEEVDINPDQVQIECMVDQDGKEVKKVKPILIKKRTND